MKAPGRASRRQPHLVQIATDPLTAFRLMDGQLAELRRRGFRISVITAPGQLLEQVATREGVDVYPVQMHREMSPVADLVSLVQLVRLLRKLEPDLVNAGTPKAGLLGCIAARCAGVPTVVYQLRGLRFEGATGVKRLLLSATEHVSAAMAHRIFCNSASLREHFVALGCAPREKTTVLANGTSNGVDVRRFEPSAEGRAWARSERAARGIPESALVVGFVGRFARDKGLEELLLAFGRLTESGVMCHLLLVGSEDPTDPLPSEVGARLRGGGRVHLTGFVEEPGRFYAMMDVFAFPSYREGFPNAPLEAACAGIPSVAFLATGTVDAIVDGVTGTLVPAKDWGAMAAALKAYADDAALRQRHGTAARERAARLFSREVVWSALEQEYRRLLARP